MEVDTMGSVELRKAATEMRDTLGFKFRRQMTADECRKFLKEGIIPSDVMSKACFVAVKPVAFPESMGACCRCCGENLSGKDGYIATVVDGKGKPTYIVFCSKHYAEITETENLVATPPPEALTASTPTADTDPVAAAMAALTAALTAKKKPEPSAIDESKVAEIVRSEIGKANITDKVDAACKAAFAKSVGDFLKDGVVPASAVSEEDTPHGNPATGDAVGEASNALGWKARSTAAATDAVKTLNNFLSEFSYFRKGASMRLVNTFAIAEDKKSALFSYCEVSQMEDYPDLMEKMKSPEFEEVCKKFLPFKGKVKPLNTRFAVFYGNPGGGKTYAAINAARKINGDGKCDIVPCSPSMDAADLLYAYRLDYKTGKRGYVPTALLTAMTTGRAVVLDEINLLPMEARMFLQDILDNKPCVHVMGVELQIKNGFFVIGTMNLETGLGSQPLPQPLVDRACVIREFRTSASQCAVGAGLC